MGSTDCWKTLGQDLIDQHSLCQGGSPSSSCKRKTMKKIFAEFIQVFHPTYFPPNIPILPPLDPNSHLSCNTCRKPSSCRLHMFGTDEF